MNNPFIKKRDYMPPTEWKLNNKNSSLDNLINSAS